MPVDIEYSVHTGLQGPVLVLIGRTLSDVAVPHGEASIVVGN
jgi:hypothetical protein